jgi:delta14-sterol reductase
VLKSDSARPPSSQRDAVATGAEQPEGASRSERIGFALQLVGLPIFSLYVVLCVRVHGGALALPDARFWSDLAAPTPLTLALYTGWIASQLMLAAWLPGRSVPGPPLTDGGRLRYRRNGLAVLLASYLGAGLLVFGGVLSASVLYDELVPLAVTVNLGAWALALWIFFTGRGQATDAERRRGFLEAFYLGATLNPRSGPIDWKYWMQGKPGLTLWSLLGSSCAAAQIEQHGELSNAMLLVSVGVSVYVIDYFWHEDQILSAWDVKHEPMGWMLTWGSCAMVPLVYGAPLPYLVAEPVSLQWPVFVALAGLALGGLIIFRQANTQKHRFRADPAHPIWGRPPEYIETVAGTRLLCSGWWGLARHCNYLGDWLMSLTWALATGFASVLPYIYPAFFIGLLVHRERRDHAHCGRKYGKDWERYVERVPRRIVPFLY